MVTPFRSHKSCTFNFNYIVKILALKIMCTVLITSFKISLLAPLSRMVHALGFLHSVTKQKYLTTKNIEHSLPTRVRAMQLTKPTLTHLQTSLFQTIQLVFPHLLPSVLQFCSQLLLHRHVRYDCYQSS